MVICFKLHTEFGVFVGEEMQVSIDQYNNLIDKSREFHQGNYDMFLTNGFLVATPEIIKKSILVIEILKPD